MCREAYESFFIVTDRMQSVDRSEPRLWSKAVITDFVIFTRIPDHWQNQAIRSRTFFNPAGVAVLTGRSSANPQLDDLRPSILLHTTPDW